jgi:D-glycero-alpha-D-manno-heptose-7-phosphate kinase
MTLDLKPVLEQEIVEASAPCRVDMGGTLDIPPLYLSLGHLAPCVFNIAVNLRTRVRLFPYRRGWVKISSAGFSSQEFRTEEMPFTAPLGLMFAVAAHFNVSGVQVDIDSTSPPRSGLGGSSVAAVAMIAALSRAVERSTGKPRLPVRETALLARAIEAAVAGLPCGIQDMLAAAYGGVNAWYLPAGAGDAPFLRQVVVKKTRIDELNRSCLLAYCGLPHESYDINGQWIRGFLEGRTRKTWREIAACSSVFVAALRTEDLPAAIRAMNREVDLRRELTPGVLEPTGSDLVAAARQNSCGARFTGAGGGGCIWALGEPHKIDRLREDWQRLLAQQQDAALFDIRIDPNGITLH